MSDAQESFKSRAITGKKLLYVEGALSLILGASFIIFGWYVLAITAVSVAISVLVDFIFARTRKTKMDEGWLLFPLVFALMLPPTVPLWMAGVGIAFGNLFAKQLFGGYGRTIFNPAVVGIIFLWISFPTIMFGWHDPGVLGWFNPFSQVALDAIEPMTPLHQINADGTSIWSINDLLLGVVPGNIGETFSALIIVLGVLLMAFKVIDWKYPVSILGSYLILGFILELFGATGGTIASVLTGGLLLGTFFIASDPVHAPVHTKAIWLYGFGVALITFVIRYFATFSEGFVFAVIIMSAVGALIEGWLTSKEQAA